ncbi:MAG: leucine--tRNA ligase [Alphaproteobacteria bacterium TMED62]|nr:MAG: leucine--tRNA ligase [Alphaproteobacteria bacterium TMED62]
MTSHNKQYDHKKVEAFWQDEWNKKKLFSVKNQGEPYYVLEMFPYPSGRIHMGHVRVYTLGDVLARYKRAKGFDVFHPMGWDSFGMPAENAAIENAIHPKEWTKNNIDNMKTQLKSMGISYDWKSEISTCEPEYIKEQQKIFIKLFNANLIYKKESWANWDPVENSVLANEQVIDGKGWRSGAPIEKKLLNQWFLAITKFAKPLLDNLDNLKEWPENVKIMQKNWIGESIGAKLSLKIIKNNIILDIKEIEVFTTRPDTIFGASFVAIAPDHTLSEKLSKGSKVVEKFIKEWKKSFISEEDLDKAPKNGLFTNLYVLHPFLDIPLPIYIANFVLSSYGTGAVIGVPAHDQRDFDFAKKYDLEIKQVIREPQIKKNVPLKKAYTGNGLLVNSNFLNNMTVKEAKIEIINRFEIKGIGKKDIKYRLRDWCASRQRYWGCPIPIIYREDGAVLPVEQSELPIELPTDIDFSKGGNPLENHPTWKYTTCKKTGLKALRETDTLDTFFDSSWYYLRFINSKDELNLKSDLIKKWCPVHQYVGGIEHAVLHLLYSRFLIRALSSINEIEIQEPFKGLFCQGMVCHKTYKDEENKWVFPEDIVKKENILTHKITGKKVSAIKSEKMSKSKKNIVDPVSIIKDYGADTARIFMLSDSPPERNLDWSNSGIEGSRKFIIKIWNFFNKLNFKENNYDKNLEFEDYKSSDFIKKMHLCIYKVTKNLDNFQYNVAVASLREFSNYFLSLKLNNNNNEILHKVLSIWVIMIGPIAPHFAEELWKILGHETLLAEQPWPKSDERFLQETNINFIIQINGKKKCVVNLPKGLTKDQIENIVLENDDIKKMLINNNIKKIIIIPDRVANLVV